MANLLLDANMMLDVQLTQRLLLNVPSYDGKAGFDILLSLVLANHYYKVVTNESMD